MCKHQWASAPYKDKETLHHCKKCGKKLIYPNGIDPEINEREKRGPAGSLKNHEIRA